MIPTHANPGRDIVLLPMNVRSVDILRDGKPEVLDLERERWRSRTLRGEPLTEIPSSPIPDPWEGRK